MKVLSIDQSLTNTGLCVFSDGELEEFLSISSDKTLEDWQRIVSIRDFIKTYIRSSDLVAMEGLSMGSISPSVRPLAGLFYQIRIEVADEVPFVEVPPTTLKKFATGSGRAKKKDMWQSLPTEVQERVGQSPYKTITKGKYDIADAYHIGKYAIENFDKGLE